MILYSPKDARPTKLDLDTQEGFALGIIANAIQRRGHELCSRAKTVAGEDRQADIAGARADDLARIAEYLDA